MRPKNALHRPGRQTQGWLVLHRRLLEELRLEHERGDGPAVRITLVDTDPITLALELPGLGEVELFLEPDRRGVKFGLRAGPWVRIVRGELDAR